MRMFKKNHPDPLEYNKNKKGSLIISLSAIFIISLLVLTLALNLVSIRTTTDALYGQMEENAVQIADIVANEMINHNNISDGFELTLSNYIYSLGHAIGAMEDLSVEYLKGLANSSAIQEVSVIDNRGNVTFSNIDELIGSRHPLNTKMSRVIFSTTPAHSLELEKIPKDNSSEDEIDTFIKIGGVQTPIGSVIITLSGSFIDQFMNDMNIEKKFIEMTNNDNVVHIVTVNRQDNIVYDSREHTEDNIIVSENGKKALSNNEIYSEQSTLENGLKVHNVFVPIRNQYGTYEGFINVAFSTDPVQTAASDILKRSIFLGSIVFILILALTVGYFYYKIGNPLKLMMKYISNISQFDLRRNADVDRLLRENNEIGSMAIELEKMRGNLTEILENIKGSSLELSEYTEVISKNSNETSLSIGEVSRAVEELASGASEQAKESSRSVESLNDLSKKIEDLVSLSKNMHNNTQDMSKANETSVESIHSIQESFGEIVNHFNTMSNRVDSLAKKSEAIDKIAQAIKSISEETNLLALNAAIEAARAGEHGRGFAVVADEIRKLSDETSKSAQNVGKIIGEVGEEISKVKEEMRNSTAVIKTFDESTERSIKAFDRIKSIIEESISQINTLVENVYNVDSNKAEVISALESITAIIQQASASTEEVAASVEEQSSIVDGIAEMTEKLKDMAQGLENTIDSFKID